MDLAIVVLAAGQGKRMRSHKPKVLHPLAGRPLLEHVVTTARQLEAAQIAVVYGHGGEQVTETLAHLNVQWVHQAEQLGTGHAVMQAFPTLGTPSRVLILYGDVPLITAATLQRLVAAAGATGMSMLTVELGDPSGYGRIVRDDNSQVAGIVEEQDATPAQRAIREINTGMMVVPRERLQTWLQRLNNANAQGEYYLTDIVAMAAADGVSVATVMPDFDEEVLGVNTRAQLAELERCYQAHIVEQLMARGVSFADPARFDLRGEIETGEDVFIDVNVVLEGRIKLGDRVSIGPNNYIRNTEVDDDVQILPNCVIEDSVIGKGARLGPFSRLRPEAKLGEHVHIGNFVEVKKSNVGKGSKINHLSYVGDSDVGRDVNIGAGTITCNYDGANKHRTVIGDEVFIGSNTQLIAPVKVGDGATIGAGTTVVKDVPPGILTVGRARQELIPGWQRPKKKKKT